MKEIDINIEGYNVNGICVGCLNYNRRMFYVDEVKECFKFLAEIDVPDGLSIQVCWECLAAVRTVVRFREQILNAYDVLIDYSAENPYLSSTSDFTSHAANRLSMTVPLSITIRPEETKDEVEVKSEQVQDEEEQFEVKDEFAEVVKSEDELPELDANSDGFAPDPASSDDDMQLSKLRDKKEKKEKKIRKRQKKNADKEPKPRKLKSLPEDLVEVYTMTEEEMWAMRAEDLANAEFQSFKNKCKDCLLTFNSRKLMNEHMLSKHRLKSENCHKCDVCNSYFLGKDHLTTHRALHLAAYRCARCGAATSVRRRARRHAHAHAHRGAEDAHECTLCGKTFSSGSKLAYHRSTNHHKEKLQCDCCGKVFASKMTLKYHLRNVSQNKEDKPKETLYIPCKGCNKVFNSKKSYRAHVVIHNGLTYPCPICGKLFQWKRNLARHTRNHRERDAGATYECRACGKTFASKDCYNNHMRLSKRHVPEDAYAHTCNYCGKKFATKYCMVDHIDWDHLKRIKYQCNVCFKAFKTAKIMVAHINNIHGGKRNKEPDGQHLCDVCGKSYKSVKRLKSHVWSMHTNRSSSKIFKCKLCPATFAWQTSIYKHTKMMHGNTKRLKQPRPGQPGKKQESYPEIELTNRMQYFQQNIVPNISHTVQPLPVGIGQNIV